MGLKRPTLAHELANHRAHPLDIRVIELLERESCRRRDVGQPDAPTGALRCSNQFSAARQPISAQKPPIIQAVSTTSSRPVLLQRLADDLSSSGLIVRRSMTSASMPSAASLLAACSASSMACDAPTIVRSCRDVGEMPLPIGTR